MSMPTVGIPNMDGMPSIPTGVPDITKVDLTKSLTLKKWWQIKYNYKRFENLNIYL